MTATFETDAFETVRKFIWDNTPDEETREELWYALRDVHNEGWQCGYDEGYDEGCDDGTG